MQFQVPQFIDVEDRIFGPLTLKQFIYLAGGAGVVAITYLTLPFFLTILIGLPALGLSAALAFYKVNNRPFSAFLESAFYYITGTRFYVWKNSPKKRPAQETPAPPADSVFIPRLRGSRLTDLAARLDTDA